MYINKRDRKFQYSDYEYRRKINALKHKRKRRRRLAAFYIFLILTIFIVGIYFVVHSFFKLNKVEISGSKKYTYKQVQECAGVEIGQNIFKYKSQTIVNKLKNKLIYIDKVEVKKVLPSKISIVVTDAEPNYFVKEKEDCFVLSKNLKVLEKLSFKDFELSIKNSSLDFVKIFGISLTDESVGKFIFDISSNKEKTNILIILNKALNNNKFKDITQISLVNKNNVKIKYEDRILILLGSWDQMDYKIKFAKHIIDSKLDKNERGTIDLTSVLDTSKVYYYPYKERLKKLQEEEQQQNTDESVDQNNNNTDNNENNA